MNNVLREILDQCWILYRLWNSGDHTDEDGRMRELFSRFLMGLFDLMTTFALDQDLEHSALPRSFPQKQLEWEKYGYPAMRWMYVHELQKLLLKLDSKYRLYPNQMGNIAVYTADGEGVDAKLSGLLAVIEFTHNTIELFGLEKEEE